MSSATVRTEVHTGVDCYATVQSVCTHWEYQLVTFTNVRCKQGSPLCGTGVIHIAHISSIHGQCVQCLYTLGQ